MAPKFLALMHIQPPITGDAALLQLARLRLQEAGLGGELYPGSPEHVDALLAFQPAQPCTAHLPRDINLLDKSGQDAVVAFAGNSAGKFFGLVVHDHDGFADRVDEVVAAFRSLDKRLGEIDDAPLLFVEYAVGLELDYFVSLFEKTRELTHVSACADIGHMGIFSCRQRLAERFDGQDVCELRLDAADLPERIEAIQQAVWETSPIIVNMINRLTELGKPVHFHLHDGHPLSTLSLFGVSDHLSFLQKIQIPFPYRGRQLLDGIYGPEGLNRIMHAALSGLPADKLSFTLELHPQPGRTPLERHAYLFDHWADKTNAERMNYWLDRLIENSILLRNAYNEHCQIKQPSFS
jgi:hypothetical protein